MLRPPLLRLMDYLQLNIEGREAQPVTKAEAELQAAILAAVAATIISLILRFALGAPLVPEILADYLFEVLPIELVEFAVSFFGAFAKQLGFIGCVILYGLFLVAVGVLSLRLRILSNRTRLLTLAAGLSLLNLFFLIPLLGGGLLGRELRQGSIISTVAVTIVCAAYAVTLSVLSRWFSSSAPPGSIAMRLAPDYVSRRRIVKWIGASVLAVGVYDICGALFSSWFEGGSGRIRKGTGVFPNIDGLAIEVTPNPDFYQVSKNPYDPDVDIRRWKLEIGGQVENPLSLTLDQLRALPAVEQYATLECISNEVGGDLIGNALWRGAPLKELLNQAQVKEGALDLVLHAADKYSDSIPLERAMRDGVMLAYEMNGALLNTTHGFPLRLIVPGIFGMKNVKWITRIELVNYDFKGYWQKRGWDDRAEYKTMSRIDAPNSAASGAATICGIAFAGDREISKVEISTDGGKNWELADVKPGLSPFSWVLWKKDWTPSVRGKHSIVVRATDGRGIVQTSSLAPPLPSGASGYHIRIIETA